MSWKITPKGVVQLLGTTSGSFIAELVGSLKKTLSTFPEAGQVYNQHDFDYEIRSFPSGSYLSFYQVIESIITVEILYIFHSKRDIAAFIQGL
jgi:plasmid stabilization system protein ParE